MFGAIAAFVGEADVAVSPALCSVNREGTMRARLHASLSEKDLEDTCPFLHVCFKIPLEILTIKQSRVDVTLPRASIRLILTVTQKFRGERPCTHVSIAH